MVDLAWIFGGGLLLTGLLARHLRGRRADVQNVSEVCQILLSVMQDLQLHRGLSGTVLDGRDDFRLERESIEYKLQRSLHALAEHYGSRHTVFRDGEWRIVLGRWESLHNNWQGLDFCTNLSVHSEVIHGLIGILGWMSETHSGVLGNERAKVISRWPYLIENLGTLRALGMHVLSSEQFADDERVAKAIADQRLSALRNLKQASRSGAERALIIRSERVSARVEWLMDGHAASYHPYTYYEEITGVIDDWYRQLIQRVQFSDRPRSAVRRCLASLLRSGVKLR